MTKGSEGTSPWFRKRICGRRGMLYVERQESNHRLRGGRRRVRICDELIERCVWLETMMQHNLGASEWEEPRSTTPLILILHTETHSPPPLYVQSNSSNFRSTLPCLHLARLRLLHTHNLVAIQQAQRIESLLELHHHHVSC